MSGQTKTGTENQNILGVNGEILFSKGEMLLIKINMQQDADSDYVCVVAERHYNRLYVVGVGLTIADAIYDAIRRSAQFDDVEGIKKIKALERARYQGDDNE
jgi:hypothetical protein